MIRWLLLTLRRVMFHDPLVAFDTTQATANSPCVTFPFLWVIFDTPLHVISCRLGYV